MGHQWVTIKGSVSGSRNLCFSLNKIRIDASEKPFITVTSQSVYVVINEGRILHRWTMAGPETAVPA